MKKHKEDCLNINGTESVDVKEGIIKFENYSRQLPVPFKIYADFECNLQDTEIYEGSCTKKYHDHVPCSYAYKIVCIDDRFSKLIVVYRGENAAYEFIKAILKEYKYCKNIMKKHFNKNLIMSEEEEYLFQQSNNCWICKKLINNDVEKVRDHCHVTGKFRGAAHRDCNINFKLTKGIFIIIHNLKDYDSHLIFSVLYKCNLKISVIKNGLEKYIVKEFVPDNLEILKQKGAYTQEWMNSSERFNEEKLPARKYFFSSTEKGKIDSDGKISDGHISIKDYMACEKVWDKFNMKNMGDYHDHY